jgi:glyoxylase-like metal-dependent hydrolase (beta-lactamase superfamily II)
MAGLKVHHLACGTFCPVGSRLGLTPSRLVCHCLLIETPGGLVLVDSGIGLQDIEHPSRLGMGRVLARPVLDPSATAVRRVQALGYAVSDVRDIVLTHLDFDHAGGIADFPGARIHVFSAEYVAAMAPTTLAERLRYRKILWSHSPRWTLHNQKGPKWFGFEAVRDLAGLPPEIVMVPLTGHTWGHCGVAVEASSGGWLLHAGDAYFHRSQVRGGKPRMPAGLSAFERSLQVDDELRIENLGRLKELAAAHPGEIRVFSAHDAEEFAQLSARP